MVKNFKLFFAFKLCELIKIYKRHFPPSKNLFCVFHQKFCAYKFEFMFTVLHFSQHIFKQLLFPALHKVKKNWNQPSGKL